MATSSSNKPEKFKGKKSLIHQSNMLRCFDGDLFEKNRKYLRRQKPPCAICGKLWQRTFQVDHIRPLALFRILLAVFNFFYIKFYAVPDGLDNLQIICKKCHKQKTVDDLKRIAEVRSQLQMYLPEEGFGRQRKIS